jgi:hypothetical protein
LRRTIAVVASGGALAVGAVVPVACSSSPKRDTASFCSAYVDVASSGAKLSDPDEVSLPTLRKQVRAIDDAAADAADVAPEAIADTVDAVIAPLHTLREDLDDAEGRKAADRALIGYRIDAGKLSAQQKRLDTWAAANCDVVPVTSTTAPVTIAPGVTG